MESITPTNDLRVVPHVTNYLSLRDLTVNLYVTLQVVNCDIIMTHHAFA